MSYCQPEEKAYLRVNGSEVWAFDGPISVTMETFQEWSPGSRADWVLWFSGRDDGFENSPWRSRVQGTANLAGNTLPFGSVSVKPFGSGFSWGPGQPTYYPYYLLTIPSGGPQGFAQFASGQLCNGQPLPNAVLARQRWMRITNVEPLTITNVVGSSVTKYRLTVNGRTIKISNDPIEYTVRCGDRCPPGEKWSEKCNACVCEGMDGILADLRGATAMARQLRNKA